MPRKVLLVSASSSVRTAIHQAIQGEPFQIVGEAATHNEGISHFPSLGPHAVIKDMTVSPHETMSALRHFHKRFPLSRILLLYSHLSRPNFAAARRAGAQELLAFPFSKEHFLEALNRLTENVPEEEDA